METALPDSSIIEQIKDTTAQFQGLSHEVGKVIIGHQDIIQFMMIAILCDGHILLEGVPGVAKTTMIKALTKALGLKFNRIQFTPDLLPSDVIGTLIYNPKTQEFETKKGPIFANLILADEINRAPAKVQAALLEAMQEKQVTIGSQTFKLQEPFLVFATQNPIEQEGTYQLPEAQVDRFMFKLLVNYPNKHEEKELLLRSRNTNDLIQILTEADILLAQKLVEAVYVDDKIIEYLVNIIFATRAPESYGLTNLKSYIQSGVSPRATITLYQSAKAYAFLRKRHFVTPDDIKAVALPALRHRLVLTYQAEADGLSPDMVINKILQTIPSP
ncbi:MAG: AAA family ATPase [Candidatus Dependentiae bacterium]